MLREFINRNEPDVICLHEVNVAWQKLPIDQRLGQRFQENFGLSYTKCAWYRNYPKVVTARQSGGCAIVVLNNAVGRVVQSGDDTTGQGRWCWVRMEGKDGRHFRVISAYRPVKNTKLDFSVYNQQKLFQATKNNDNDVCPRQRFITDLLSDIDKFKSQGDDILLSLDLNDDVRDTTSEFGQGMDERRLREVSITKHGQNAPPTTNRGSRPIDGMFLSADTSSTGCGYLPFEDDISDHRPLWVDIDLDELFGQAESASKKVICRRLKCKDPRVVKKYMQRYDQYLVENNLYKQASDLEKNVREVVALTMIQKKEFEAIDRLRIQGMQLAEKQCRKLKMGKVEWSSV